MMRSTRRYGYVVVGGLIGLLGVVALVGVFARWPRKRVMAHDLRRVTVKRADIHVTLTTAGTIDSAERTLIECELENIRFSNEGRTFSVGGTSTILSLIPDGSDVKAGDVLCEFDASDYQELVRQQQLQVEEERADLRAAELKRTTALEALAEFENGLKRQAIEELQGNITLAESNYQTLAERVRWSERMLQFGYVAPARLASERVSLLRAAEAVRSARDTLKHYEEFVVPQITLTLQAEVQKAESTLAYQTLRLASHEERLLQLQKQVELCTVRAPHDGFVIYANEDDGDRLIELGATVRTKQDLFYLPDLSKMQVVALLHESVVEQVEPGMRARVWVEALPDRELEGKVLSISPLPYRNSDWRQSPDIKQFVARIELHGIPKGLKPGMSAGVEILRAEMPDALVVPVDAVKYDQGREVCYVAGADGIERREVSVIPATTELLCVQQGLDEGEEVLLEVPGPDAPWSPDTVPLTAE